MAEPDDMVLRLLREIRSEIVEVRKDTDGLKAWRTRQERQMSDMQENIANAMGWSVHSTTAVETYGQRMDELRDQIDALTRRVRELENAR